MIEFSDSNYNSWKNLTNDFTTSASNNNFEQYLEDSLSENLILRYSDLTAFILSSKTEKLKTFSKVIGLNEIDKVKEVLKKGFNYLKNTLRSKSFDNEINRRKGDLLKIFEEEIISDQNYIDKVNLLIKELNIEPVTALFDIEKLTERFKSLDDTQIVQERLYYQNISASVTRIKEKITSFYEEYKKYWLKFEEITKEKENLKKLALERLLKEGLSIIEKKHWQLNKCPLCLGEKDLEELALKVQQRLEEINTITGKKRELEDIKENIKQILSSIKNDVISIERDKLSSAPKNLSIQDFVEKIKKYIDGLITEIDNAFETLKIRTIEEIQIDESIFIKVQDFCERAFTELEKNLKGKKIIEIQDKVTRSFYLYSELKKIKKEKEVIESYKSAFEKIYDIFIQKQKSELESFINNFSNEINTYYSELHPSESVSNISLKLIGESDELKGLTLEYEFYNNRVSPPQKFLSESHLNSLGIAFFLASVKAFNKRNKFFILDDIISSFDIEHRFRLSRLLVERFNDYQIIVLTHEHGWFEYMKNFIKGNSNWLITSVYWSDEEGTHVDLSKVDLKYLIEDKIRKNDTFGLGNLMRKYLEKILKEICEDLEVRVRYLSNERNEQRMCNELLSDLKNKINQQPSKDKFSIIDNLLKSVFIGNIESHDREIRASIGDLKTFWEDILKLESLFNCNDCNKRVSINFSNENDNKIQCKCGKLEYEWKF